MLSKDEKKKEKEYCAHEGRWSNFIINNNQILSDLNKMKEEVTMLKHILGKFKKYMTNKKVATHE